jgi:hypothetical protein
MTDTPEDVARRAAARLAREIDPALPAVVEGQLRGGGGAEPPVRFFEPATTIALGGLLVSLASLAWTIYRDLKKDAAAPAPEVLARRLRLDADLPEAVTSERRERLIAVVVEEVIAGSGPGS